MCDYNNTVLKYVAQPNSVKTINDFTYFLCGHAVLRRVNVTFVDTVLRIEHIPENSKTGIALEIRISKYVWSVIEEIDISPITDK